MKAKQLCDELADSPASLRSALLGYAKSLEQKLAEQQAFIRSLGPEIAALSGGDTDLAMIEAASHEQGRLAGRAEVEKEYSEAPYITKWIDGIERELILRPPKPAEGEKE